MSGTKVHASYRVFFFFGFVFTRARIQHAGWKWNGRHTLTLVVLKASLHVPLLVRGRGHDSTFIIRQWKRFVIWFCRQQKQRLVYRSGALFSYLFCTRAPVVWHVSRFRQSRSGLANRMCSWAKVSTATERIKRKVQWVGNAKVKCAKHEGG